MRKLVEEGYDNADYGGAFRRDETLRENEAEFMNFLIKKLPKNAKILDFGCGLGIPHDKFFVKKGMDVTGIDITVVEALCRPGDVSVMIADSSRIRTELGWKPQYEDIHSIIQTAWDWHCRYPEGYAR